jgi:signal transduction histidine kinase
MSREEVNAGLQRKDEGTVLGVAIAKQLVERHGGTLAIDRARGAGTSVTVLPPAVRVMAAA